MNRYIVLPVILCALVISSAYASAQTTTPSTSTLPDNTNPSIPTKRVSSKEPTLQKIAQNRLLNLAANMSNRMDSVVARLQNVIDRLTTRLDKMVTAGSNVSAARTELNLAQSKLDEAKQNLASIDVEVNAFVGSATPRENWENLKKTYLSIRDTLVSSHQSILATINLAQKAAASPVIQQNSTTSKTNI